MFNFIFHDPSKTPGAPRRPRQDDKSLVARDERVASKTPVFENARFRNAPRPRRQDDKGLVAICVAGMPPFAPHPDDPARAALAALEVCSGLSAELTSNELKGKHSQCM